MRGIRLTGVGSIAYVAFAATLFGFGVWGYLLRQYDASTVAPFSLLVPARRDGSAAGSVARRSARNRGSRRSW